LDPGRQSGVLQVFSCSSAGLTTNELLTLFSEEYSASVSDLSIADLPIKDDFIDHLIREAPKLERLDISRTYVTGVALKALATRPQGPVKWLDVRNCSHVPIDAVRFAQSTGISIKYG